ncbi:MAG: glycosyltransferase [Candidatus Omnitrophota bacterium]
MTVSIIIAVKTWQRNLEECVAKCRELDFPDFEIIVLPDGPVSEAQKEVRIIPTGPVSPAHKRDIGFKQANGEIIAFLDDDAWPEKAWLKNAIRHFSDASIAAVGGPAVTPVDDSLWQKASGAVYSSPLVSGKYIYRYMPRQLRQVDDYPSCNFIVRKAVLEKTGGFNTNFWPGEDTKLCLDITQKLGKKIIYDPQVLVYHHRRPVFLPHLKQIASYAVHRGYFVKRYPETSLRPAYFVPSIFLIGIVLGMLVSLFVPVIRLVYLPGVFLYLLLVLIFSLSNGLSLLGLVLFGIITTHITYGAFFIKGLLTKQLSEEN